MTLVENVRKGTIRLIQIFGISPIMEEAYLGDESFGARDAILLGLIPKSLQQTMRHAFRVKHSGLPRQQEEQISTQLLSIWDKVQELLIAKIAGLHRSISTIVKEKEKGWKVKFREQLSLQSFKHTKKCARINNKKRKSPITADTSPNPIKKEKKNPESDKWLLKTCTGITCRPTNITIGSSPPSPPNSIQQGKLQCQRCSKQHSAMKKGIQALQEASEKSQEEQKKLVAALTSQDISRPDYTSLMNLLDNNSSTQLYEKAKFKNKKRKLRDQDKQICQIILEESNNTAPDSRIASPDILNMATCIKDKLQSSKQILKHDIEYERKVLSQIHSLSSDNTLPLSDKGDTADKPPENAIVTNNNERKKKYALLLTKWQLFSGNDLDADLALLRPQLPNHTYLADQDVAFLIQAYNCTDDWQRFGRMFRSNGVRSSKPSGVYIIPLFWGNHRSGHWSCIFIWRIGRRNRGFHLDSVGKSNTRGNIFDKIRSAFTGRRDRFSWIETNCMPQQELECGFRTIEAIRTVCKGISEGKEVNECIRAASLMDMDAENYCSIAIRKEVANRWLQTAHSG